MGLNSHSAGQAAAVQEVFADSNLNKIKWDLTATFILKALQ